MSIINDFVSLFFPIYCFSCSDSLIKGEDIICTQCLLNLPRTNYAPQDNPVKEKLVGRLSLVYGFAFLKFKKGGGVQHLLHRLKYGQHPEIGVKLGKVYGKELSDQGFSKEFDLIIPVPLHRSRLRQRGYNQSAKFAEGLSYALNVPWDDSVFFRKTRTLTQTNKSVMARWDNVKGAFAISKMDHIKGKNILLVDDIITTGATFEACGANLIRNQCAQLSIACIAEA